MKKSTLLALIIGTLLLLSFSANPPQGNSGAPTDQTCARAGCHSNAGSIGGNVVLVGIPEEVESGMTYSFNIELNVTEGNASRGGFQLVALGADNTDSGTITNAGSSSTTSSFQGRTYFEHQPAKNFNGADKLVYTADWIAPEGNGGDETTFYISSMLANGNGSSSGDTYVSSVQTFRLAEEEQALSAVISGQSDVICNGESNGSATITASGGSESYSYDWDNGETTATANQLSAGNHTVTVSDGSNNTEVTVNISEPEALIGQIEIISTLECGDDQNGALRVLADGGTPPYDYMWSNNANTEQINDLSPGQYNVTISDQNSCSIEANISLFAVDETAPVIEVVESIEIKLGADNVVIDIDNLDGILLSSSDNCTLDLSLDWTPRNFGCSDIGMTSLNITARDQSGNSTSKTVVVNVVDEIIPSLICIADEIRIGTCAPFSYSAPIAMDNCDILRLELISGIGVNGSFPLGQTRDIYMVTDGSGNTATCEITIINEPDIEINAEVTDISCAGETDGSVAIDVIGTNTPYDVSIEGIIATDRLAPGQYSFTVTDFTGCEFINSFEVEEPSELSLISFDLILPTNSNSGDGSIDISVDGGTPPYSFTWMTEDEFFSDEEDLSLLFPGEYLVDVEDSRGCTIRSEVFVLEAITSINDPVLSARILTYPNPTVEYLNIDFTETDFNSANVKLYSYEGELVMDEEILKTNNSLNLENLANGIYILKLRIDKDYIVRSILKQNGL